MTRTCSKCHMSLLALEVTNVGHNQKTGICYKCKPNAPVVESVYAVGLDPASHVSSNLTRSTSDNPYYSLDRKQSIHEDILRYLSED